MRINIKYSWKFYCSWYVLTFAFISGLKKKFQQKWKIWESNKIHIFPPYHRPSPQWTAQPNSAQPSSNRVKYSWCRVKNWIEHRRECHQCKKLSFLYTLHHIFYPYFVLTKIHYLEEWGKKNLTLWFGKYFFNLESLKTIHIILWSTKWVNSVNKTIK